MKSRLGGENRNVGQDIFSNENWNILTKGLKASQVIVSNKSVKSHSMSSATIVKNKEAEECVIRAELPTDPASLQLIEKIGVAIKCYHEICKTKSACIVDRINQLETIAKLIHDYKQSRGELFQGEENNCYPIKIPHVSLLDYKEKGLGSIDNWIDLLANCLKDKVTHLTMLHAYYKQEKPIDLNKDQLLNIIKNQHPQAEDERLKLFAGCLLEKKDCLHRPFEFSYEDILKKDDHHFEINKAFYEWLQSEEIDLPPFFLWLEQHRVTTSTKLLDKNYKFIGSIDYNPENKKTITIDINDKKLKVNNEDNLPAKNLDTLNIVKELKDKKIVAFGVAKAVISKGFDFNRTIAYVWQDNCHFITHPHKPLMYHHSSLASGKKIRCAGLWIVEDGKVMAINNHSGHYRPTPIHFYKLIRFLYENELVNDQTLIVDLTKKNDLFLKEYLYETEHDCILFLNNNHLQMLIPHYCFIRDNRFSKELVEKILSYLIDDKQSMHALSLTSKAFNAIIQPWMLQQKNKSPLELVSINITPHFKKSNKSKSSIFVNKKITKLISVGELGKIKNENADENENTNNASLKNSQKIRKPKNSIWFWSKKEDKLLTISSTRLKTTSTISTKNNKRTSLSVCPENDIGIVEKKEKKERKNKK